MAKERILVVDDEEDILELVRYNLTKENFQVISATTGEDALDKLKKESFDLILLDLMLPGRDGLDTCRIIKGSPETSQIPIMMITAKSEDTDVVLGLELGADDYVTKPFSPRVLLARIKALLRRNQPEHSEDRAIIKAHEMVINPSRHEVKVKQSVVNLTATEFSILEFLAKRPGWVFTREQIIDSVKGTDYPVTDRSVDVQIVGLRKKLGDSGDLIETVRGVGYRFKE
ncbi:MAG: response regulator transcription factor [Desulfomonilaceae bacterium]|jgi:two-component system phosphate regulon response regulator PhoB